MVIDIDTGYLKEIHPYFKELTNNLIDSNYIWNIVVT